LIKNKEARRVGVFCQIMAFAATAAQARGSEQCFAFFAPCRWKYSRPTGQGSLIVLKEARTKSVGRNNSLD